MKTQTQTLVSRRHGFYRGFRVRSLTKGGASATSRGFDTLRAESWSEVCDLVDEYLDQMEMETAD